MAGKHNDGIADDSAPHAPPLLLSEPVFLEEFAVGFLDAVRLLRQALFQTAGNLRPRQELRQEIVGESLSKSLWPMPAAKLGNRIRKQAEAVLAG
ncbi:MAG: hypothetical protein ACLFUF_06565 [Opitutales bacterium]